jgi:hypothetical protein
LWLPALPGVDLGAVPVVQGVQLLGNGGDLLHPVLQIFTTSGILQYITVSDYCTYCSVPDKKQFAPDLASQAVWYHDLMLKFSIHFSNRKIFK